MGQQSSKKIGRTKSKELSKTDSQRSISSISGLNNRRSQAPLAGQLVIPEQGSTSTSTQALEGTTPGARKGGLVESRGRGSVSSGQAAAGASQSGRSKSPPPTFEQDPTSPNAGNAGLPGEEGSRLSVAGSDVGIPTTNAILGAPELQQQGGSSKAHHLFPGRSSSPPPPQPSNLSASPAGPTYGSSPLPSSSFPPQGSGISTVPGSTVPRTLDVDNMIQRLLEAGYSGKVTKNPPLKNAEITSVCLAAREVFLSQPTLIELSPPVKIVGDVHGQASRTVWILARFLSLTESFNHSMRILSDSSRCADSHRQPTTSSSVITSIGGNSPWRRSCYSCATRSSIRKTFSCFGETTSVPMSQEVSQSAPREPTDTDEMTVLSVWILR